MVFTVQALSDFSVCGAARRHFSFVLYTVLTVQAYQRSTELLSTWCRAAAFFSASDAALLQEVL
jgi:hypothetical protein